MHTFAHIINPVNIGPGSDLHVAQPVTFETMRRAREMAHEQLEVQLFSAQFHEDLNFVPGYFSKTANLDRSVLDVGNFNVQRKLPLLKDILDRIYKASKADYFIYTNVDIALLPSFYNAVDHMIGQGYDAFTVNRRTISKSHTAVSDIPFMYAQVGEPHLGHDCFVYRRDAYERFELEDACIGISWADTILMWNLICTAENYKEFKDLHITFHVGNDEVWKQDKYADYINHNVTQASNVLNELSAQYGDKIEEMSQVARLRRIERFESQATWLKKTKKRIRLRTRVRSLLNN